MCRLQVSRDGSTNPLHCLLALKGPELTCTLFQLQIAKFSPKQTLFSCSQSEWLDWAGRLKWPFLVSIKKFGVEIRCRWVQLLKWTKRLYAVSLCQALQPFLPLLRLLFVISSSSSSLWVCVSWLEFSHNFKLNGQNAYWTCKFFVFGAT